MDQFLKRRRVPRRDFERDIGVLVDGKYTICKSIQIGEGGMMLEMPGSYSLEQKMVVTFKLPQTIPAIVRGVVRYALEKPDGKGFRYGIEFERVEFKIRREIRNYVASKSDEEYKKAAYEAA